VAGDDAGGQGAGSKTGQFTGRGESRTDGPENRTTPSREQASASGEQASASGEQASASREQASASGEQAPDFREQAPDFGEQAPDLGQQAPDFGEQASASGEQAPDFGEQAPRSGGPISPNSRGRLATRRVAHSLSTRDAILRGPLGRLRIAALRHAAPRPPPATSTRPGRRTTWRSASGHLGGRGAQPRARPGDRRLQRRVRRRLDRSWPRRDPRAQVRGRVVLDTGESSSVSYTPRWRWRGSERYARGSFGAASS
jgi:hypothetical protein